MAIATTPPSIAALERAALTAVPAARVAYDGPFVIRAFLGGTGRANATSSLDPGPDPGLAARIPRIESRYAALGLPARFRSTPLDPPGLGALLEARGYARKDETVVLAGPARFAKPDPAVAILDRPSADWFAVIATAEYQTPARRAEKERGPEMLAAPAAWLLLQEEGTPAAAASVVADGPLGGLFDLATRPEFRRRGLAARILAAAAHWAVSRGASWMWGQVAATNAASLALNQSLGLTEQYRYQYLIGGGAL